MVILPLVNKEWYFLHIQIEKLIKENPKNYIAQNIFDKLVENKPSLINIKNDIQFKKEYKCNWIGEII